jgi:hypothetical protein
MPIQMVGLHLFMRTDRQTDRCDELMVTFHDYFVYSPKKEAHGKRGATCAILFVLFLVTLWINVNVFFFFFFLFFFFFFFCFVSGCYF